MVADISGHLFGELLLQIDQAAVEAAAREVQVCYHMVLRTGTVEVMSPLLS